MQRLTSSAICSLSLAAALAVGLLCTPAHAVIIRGGDGTGNTTAPSDDPGWANVGKKATGGATAVYLGNQWVLTANHVGPGDVIFGGVTYSMVPGSWHRLQTPETCADPSLPPVYVDLGMFQIDTQPPGLAELSISPTTPPTGAEVLGAGYGRDREPNETWWNSSWEKQTGTPAFYGFNWVSSSSKRWGRNHVAGTKTIYNTETFYTTFSRFGGAGNDEMQAALGDSGGAVFYKRGDQWELSGIMLAIAQYIHTEPDQPFETAVYGNLTYAADLSVYRDQIMALYAVPEPGTMLLALLALAAAGGAWKLRKRRGS